MLNCHGSGLDRSTDPASIALFARIEYAGLGMGKEFAVYFAGRTSSGVESECFTCMKNRVRRKSD